MNLGISQFKIPVNKSEFQNKMIESIYSVTYNLLIEKIKKSNFNSIIIDESTDIKNTTQLSFTVKWVEKGNIYENFIAFHALDEKKDQKKLQIL